MLRIEKLRVGELPPLTFEVRGGECLAVEGRSGSGKTRLLRAIADLDSAAGYVRLNGTERGELTPSQWRRQVRFVPTEPGWWAPTGARHAPAARPARDRFRRLVQSLDLAAETLSRPIGDLSTGERRRLTLAIALADEPAVLLLDEPTSGLDAERSALVEEAIRFQLLAGRIVLLVAHDSGLLARLATERLQLTAPGPTPATTGAAGLTAQASRSPPPALGLR